MHRTRPCRQSLSIFWGQSVDLLASAATKNALATHAPVVQNLHVTFLASCIPALCSVLDRGWRQGLTPCARVRITTQARSPRPPCKIAPCSFLPLLPPEETDNDDDGRFNDRTGKRKQGWRSRLFCGGLPPPHVHVPAISCFLLCFASWPAAFSSAPELGASVTTDKGSYCCRRCRDCSSFPRERPDGMNVIRERNALETKRKAELLQHGKWDWGGTKTKHLHELQLCAVQYQRHTQNCKRVRPFSTRKFGL